MEIRTIHNKKEYKAALDEIEQLWSAPAKSSQAERLDVLTLLVEHYEKTHYPVADPDPIEFIEHVMESRGLTRKDLEPMIGPRGRVAVLPCCRVAVLPCCRHLEQNAPADTGDDPSLGHPASVACGSLDPALSFAG